MTAAANTKIERAVEAIESLTVAVVAAKSDPGAHQDVIDAREECRVAFREFLAPVLRAVQ